MVKQENIADTQKIADGEKASEEITPKTRGRKPMFTELWSSESGFKEEFLEFLKNDTMLTPNTISKYEITLRKISDYEINQMDKQKDLFEFTDPEIETMIRYFGFSKFKSVQSCISLINKYLIYANEKGVMKNRINFVYEKLPEEIHKLLVNRIKQEKQVITREELYVNVCDSALANFQDKICYILPFEGLNLKEMTNLKESDIDGVNNTMTIGDRIISANPQTMAIIQGAINQDIYYSENGRAENKRKEMEIVPTQYVIKPTEVYLVVGKNIPLDINDIQVNQQMIRRRIDKTKIDEEIQLPHLSYSSLRESGMRDVFLQNKEAMKYIDLTTDNIQKILGRFGKLTLSQLNKIKEEYKALIEDKE